MKTRDECIQAVSAMVALRTDEEVIWWANFIAEISAVDTFLGIGPMKTRYAAICTLASAYAAGNRLLEGLSQLGHVA